MMWNLDEQETDLISSLKPREKIGLLTNIQRMLDDDQGVVLAIKTEYGEMVWDIIKTALEGSTHKLLGEEPETKAVVPKLNNVLEVLQKIESSPVLSILQALISKIEHGPKKTEEVAAQPIVRPSSPPIEADQLSEEEKANLISARFPPRSRGINLGGL